jgi:N-acetylmuramoyl-L-alanine amidase
MIKTALIVGHTELRKGACSPHGLPCEWDFNNMVAEHVRALVDVGVHHYSSYNYGYTQMVRTSAKETDPLDYKLVLELHYNAASPSANGCEALYYFKNQRGAKIAERFCELYVDCIGGKNRGAKALYRPDQRGYGAVYYRRPTTIILEPFFGTNQEDVERIKNNMDGYAQVIVETIKFSQTIL